MEAHLDDQRCYAISHLFFTNNLLLFGETFVAEIMVMKQCLDLFCVVSGQKVNFHKSLSFFSGNVDEALQ